ncbi:MAG TPA: hypothetical protein DCZ75_17735 [Geobacter sp.]|nr:hypothetical protein [Geobacter sp.]
MNKDKSPLRRLLKVCLKTLIALIAFTIILVIYAGFKVRDAEKRVRAFSQQVVIGMPVAGLDEKASEMGLKFRRTTGSSNQSGSIQVWQGFAFGRWFCTVEYQDGKATGKRVTSLD